MDIYLENLLKKIQTIKEYNFTKLYTFEAIRFRQGELAGADEVQYNDSQWEAFAIGDYWGGRDSICWFRIHFKIPESFSAKKIAAIIQPGKRFTFKGSEGGDLREYELLVYLNGQPLQSVDVRRNKILLWDKVTPGRKHILALEAFSGLEEHQHCFEQADLVAINEDVEDFYYNVKMAFETLLLTDKVHPENQRLFNILEQTLLMVDFLQPGKEEFYKSINKANEFIRKELYRESNHKDNHPTVVCVGHSHLDIAWMWQTKHSRRKAARTFSNALRLMELYPEYRFIQSQPQLYKYIQDLYPAIFKRVKAKVKSGQWEVSGGMWVEPDTNIPGGESLVRQFLYGKRYFEKEFGGDNNVVWIPDAFGFCYSLPQIIRKSGMKYFMTTKISWSQFVKIPYHTFYWEGLDGTRILTHFISSPDPRGWDDYSVDLTPQSIQGCWDNYKQKRKNNEILLSFGWGDGGGGPLRDMLENSKRMGYLNDVLPNHKLGRVEDFFSDLENRVTDLPVWNDELYLQLHRGCYTSQAWIKRKNRLCEILYHDAELFCAINYLRSGCYPQNELNQGWELILLNQFHDILPGSSIPEVYEDSRKEYEQIESIGHKSLTDALQSICSINNSDAVHNKIAVFNSLSWTRSDAVIIPSLDDDEYWVVLDDKGRELPSQMLNNSTEIMVYLKDVPSMGYRFFEIRKSSSAPGNASNLIITNQKLENQFFIIRLDSEGLITSIYDKRFDREIVEQDKRANVLQIFEDRPIRNNAWDIDIFYQDKCLELSALEQIEVIEKGPVRGGITLKRKYLESEIRQNIYIYDSIPRIDFYTEVDWRQHETLLKVAFPVHIHSNKATYEIPYGNIERPTHWNTEWDMARFEVPAQKWADLSEADYGVSLLNDCKYGYDIKENVIRLTLIKSAIEPDPNADSGQHVFTYSLFPHQGDWRSGNTVREAYRLNVPLLSSPGSNETDLNHDYFSFVKVNSNNIIIESVKKAEDGAGIVVRLYEFHNQRGKAELEFAYPLKKAYECNLLEKEKKVLRFSNNKIVFFIEPYEIKTFILDFNKQ